MVSVDYICDASHYGSHGPELPNFIPPSTNLSTPPSAAAWQRNPSLIKYAYHTIFDRLEWASYVAFKKKKKLFHIVMAVAPIGYNQVFQDLFMTHFVTTINIVIKCIKIIMKNNLHNNCVFI